MKWCRQACKPARCLLVQASKPARSFVALKAQLAARCHAQGQAQQGSQLAAVALLGVGSLDRRAALRDSSARLSACRKGKDKIFKERYALEQEIIIVPEDIMPRKVNVEDLMKENKALKEELSYYKHKAAYHEALNEILLEDAGKEEAASKKKTVQGDKDGESSK